MIQWLGQSTTERRSRAEALLPSCYSDAFDKCLKAKTDAEVAASGFSGCPELSKLYPPGSQDAVLDSKIRAMPFCPTPTTPKAPYIIAVAAVVTTLILASRSF